MANQASGAAIIIAIKTSCKNSFESILNTEATLAPSTFLIPISLERCSVVNITNPNKPRHEIKMARKEK